MDIKTEISQIAPFRNNFHKTTVNLLFTGKWIVRLHNELFKPYGLTIQQYNILRILKGQFPKAATVKLIRERMIDKMSDASRITEHLRKKELVQRIDNSADRRKADVIITRKGLELLEAIEQKESNTMDSFLSRLSHQEIGLFDSLLNKCRL